MLVRARQGCVYPELVVQALRKKMTEFSLVEEDYPIVNLKSHSKITAITQKIIKNKATNKRKLVFCHYKDEIRKIAEILEKEGLRCAIMDGSTKKKDRKKALSAECDGENPIPDVLVVQIQTACEGLNLQHFSEIYFSTPHWNPAVEDQAVARAHRIGQKESVEVYRFVMEFKSKEDTMTLDEYCLSVQEKKREIMQMIN
jgi:SNF2 family DNA or RNA helicase